VITFIIGTRPEAIKLAPLVAKIPPYLRSIIYTGQHYDTPLAHDVWADIGGFEFDTVLTIDGQDDAQRCGHLTRGIARALPAYKPRWVVVQGDTTSTLAGALAGRKLGYPVYHVESGCRSGDLLQPEEWNRKAIDHLASGWSYSYPCDGTNLRQENIYGGLYSGDIAIDALLAQGPIEVSCARSGVVATIHRAEILANPKAVKGISDFLRELASNGKKVTLYRHPHTTGIMTDEMLTGVDVREPTTPHAFRVAMASAELVITDSGGATVEAAYLGIPCIVPRQFTEHDNLLGWRRFALGGTSLETLRMAFRNIKYAPQHMPNDLRESWSGKASEKIAKELLK